LKWGLGTCPRHAIACLARRVQGSALAFLLLALTLVIPSRSADAESFAISLVDNRAFVEVEVNGQGPFAFLLDTGSSGTTIDDSLRQRLALRPVGAGTGSGAGESRVGYATVHLDSIALGRITLDAMDVPSFDDSLLSRAIGFPHFDGVLGAELFKDHVVSIDAARAQLSVQDAEQFQPGVGAASTKITFNADDMPVVDGAVNGIAARFEVDTGDRSSLTLFGPFWRAHGLDTAVGPTVTAMTGFGAGGPIRGIVGRATSFSIGGVEVPAPVTRLSLQKAGAFTRADYAGSIGMGILKRFVVSFDYPHHRMWLLRSLDFGQADRYDRSGAWLGLGGADYLTVMDLVEGGPAASAGVRVGDHVVALDKMAASASSLFLVREFLRRPDIGAATFHVARDGAPMQFVLRLRDFIAPPH
jgi:predicted aspartyl protease